MKCPKCNSDLNVKELCTECLYYAHGCVSEGDLKCNDCKIRVKCDEAIEEIKIQKKFDYMVMYINNNSERNLQYLNMLICLEKVYYEIESDNKMSFMYLTMKSLMNIYGYEKLRNVLIERYSK